MTRLSQASEWSISRLLGPNGLGARALLWLALWSSIASGPWNIVGEQVGIGGWLNAARASMPLLVLALWVLLLPGRSRRRVAPDGALVLWALYALVMLFSALQHDRWFAYGYWALAYLSVLAAVDLTLAGASAWRGLAMVRLNWFLATAFLVLMLFLARDVLLVQSELGLTAYNLDVRAGVRGGIPISKTSGLARMAIVPAVVGFVLMIRATGWTRLLAAVVFALSASMIWFFQSRQGIFGMLFALGLALSLLGGAARVFGAMTLLVVGAVLFAGLVPEDVVDYVTAYVTRGEGARAFESMSGRDFLWRSGWDAVERSPWIGYGPEADRRLLLQNASNGLLYAGMCAGYPGAILYTGGILWGWVRFAQAFRGRSGSTAGERLFLVQLGGVMAYLTVRNVAENTASFYSVDLLLHATMIGCLGALAGRPRRQWVYSDASYGPNGPAGDRRVARAGR